MAKDRTRHANRQLGGLLAFVAGAVNAGGFLAVQRYTSHMSGIVSAIADDLVLGQVALAAAGGASLLAFGVGAATTSFLVNWARRRNLHGEYALSLMIEAGLLLVFGLLGANLERFVELFVPSTVLLLCFIMGLQNAIVTKISKAEIRTTHMTGIVTDLGIELGRLFYWNRLERARPEHFVRADRDKLAIHATILALFFGGGLVGAVAFKAVGFSATVPIAALLMALAAPPLLMDLRSQRSAAEGDAI
nr:YoaK family protein [Variovorax sp. HW608]